jgi:hypothetical protein
MEAVARTPRAGTIFLAAVAVLAAPPAGPETPPAPPPPALGLDVNLSSRAPAAEQHRAFELVRSTGVSVYALTLSWSDAEPQPGQYRVADLLHTARLLRQSGALLHLDLPLVAGRRRDVPPDLAGVAWDDSRLSLRLGRLFDAIEPALRDVATLSLGYQADVYFADKPDDLRAYRRLFDGAVHFLERKLPPLKVGVTTLAPTESPSPEVAAALHQRSPILFYVYAPFERARPWVHRAPDAVEKDWSALLTRATDRPIAFPEVSFSSAAENGSSPDLQADFVRRLRRLLSRADGRKLLFARWVSWRDAPETTDAATTPADERRRDAFLAHRGLQSADGAPKPAWRAWVRAGS